MTARFGWVALVAVAAFFLCATGMVFADVGLSEQVGEDGRISLRDESASGNGYFFAGYAARSHQGGGLRGGK